MASILTQYHVVHLKPHSCLSVTCHSNNEKRHHPPSIYFCLISVYVYSGFKLFILTPTGNNVTNQSTVLVGSSFCLYTQSLHSFPQLLQPSRFLPTPFSEVMSYICHKVRFFLSPSAHFILRSSDLLIKFLYFAYIKVYSL